MAISLALTLTRVLLRMMSSVMKRKPAAKRRGISEKISVVFMVKSLLLSC
jgi:hypothetical protein